MDSQTPISRIKAASSWALLPAIPTLWLETCRWIIGTPFSPVDTLSRWATVLGVLAAARFGRLKRLTGSRWLWSWRSLTTIGATGIATLGHLVVPPTQSWLAWITVGGMSTVLLLLMRSWWAWAETIDNRWGRRLTRVIAVGGTAVMSGVTLVVLEQAENRFAGEEFFAAISGAVLSVFFILLFTAHQRLSGQEQREQYQPGLNLDMRWVTLALFPLVLAGGWFVVRAYQTSFYSLDAPSFAGISPDTPFFCGESTRLSENQVDGLSVFDRLIASMERNPNPQPPDLGMLALTTQEQSWAEAFRQALLMEAQENRFAVPSHSVKSTQFEAALRLYYLWKVQEAFPDLFTLADQFLLHDWFAAINARALTVEWVDWLYALAFEKRPEGPYENQENGAGLLALLEVTGYAAPELSAANRDYLTRNERGWQRRFRNNDDAYIYQFEWLTNAYFQWLYTGRLAERNQRLSFYWLLLQSIPDGSVLRYNHPGQVSLAETAYLGALLLKDPRLLWVAEQALTTAESEGMQLHAQPGLEEPVVFAGERPLELSCLLYGDSGLPNQMGPLAPDKIVFRDGWAPESAYLLLNLRFAGWHRYKATNTATVVYQQGPLIQEHTIGQPFAWLPKGRSLFRDKRIPRENLNGLVIERTGMSAVLYHLTGIGGPWAQDPPHYAEVVSFEAGEVLDESHTRLSGWRGWQHDRWIFFYHQSGPIVVVDRAQGPSTSEAALAWHLGTPSVVKDRRVQLRAGQQPAEMVLVPLDSEEIVAGAIRLASDPDTSVFYRVPAGGRLNLATVFLFGSWTGAEVGWKQNGEQAVLWIVKNGVRVVVPLAE